MRAEQSPDPAYEDWQRKNEAEALETYEAQVERSEITAEECEFLYHQWLIKYREQPNTPDLKNS